MRKTVEIVSFILYLACFAGIVYYHIKGDTNGMILCAFIGIAQRIESMELAVK